MIALTRAEHSAAADELEAAILAFRARFATTPHIWGFSPASWPRLAAVIRQAVETGEDLSDSETIKRMGGEPVPPGALI